MSQFGHLTRGRQNFVSLRTVTRLKRCVLGSGDASALVQRVTAVSIPRASGIAPPKPAKTSSTPAVGNSAFTNELQTAIEERKPGTQEAKQQGGKPVPEKKKDDPAFPAPVVGVLQPAVQAQPAAAFGLPSAGIEPGAKTDSAPMQVAIDQPPPDTSAAKVTLQAPTPPADAVATDQKTPLAFALRLADRTPNRETVQPDLKTPAASEPDDPTPQPPVMAVKDTPQAVADTKIDLPVKTPVKTIEPAPSMIVAAPQREGAPESGTHPGGGASDQGAPRHTPPQPLSDLKSFRQAGAALEPVKSASKETPLPSPGPAAVTMAADQPAPQPSNRLTATTSIDHAPAPLEVARPNPASKVTDVSVTIPVPRADATGDDRIAIRMLQRGAEIHVSVRTPDTQLAQSLRQDLSKLSTGLDQGGFRTETWRPAATTSTAQSNASPQHESPAGNPNGDAAGSNGRSAGQGGQGEQKRRQQDERPRWVAELEQQQHQ